MVLIVLAKTLPVLAAVYIVSPVDFVPDGLPIAGELDDLGLLLVALGVFARLCPPAAVVKGANLRRAGVDRRDLLG